MTSNTAPGISFAPFASMPNARHCGREPRGTHSACVGMPEYP